MYFQIKEIVLWPKNITKEPRRVPFALGKINIITGASRTGKSAIIPIIDYCLGSDNCSIPVKTIRDACSWFGVVIKTPKGEKLFARREPGQQKSTDSMYVLEDTVIDIPETITDSNTSVPRVKRSLDELAGLTALDFDADGGGNNFKGRPSFRDMAAFNFQPQNIVANPDVLFFKADTYEHRQKLITIFPYVLNAVTPEMLAKQYELSRLKKDLSRKESELNSIKQVSEKWIAEGQIWVSKAKEYGLIDNSLKSTSFSELFNLLEEIANKPYVIAKPTVETINGAVQELLGLKREESNVSLELSTLKKRYSEMSKLKESSQYYRNSLQIQHDRLNVSGWFEEIIDKDHECPLCGNVSQKANQVHRKLVKSLKEIEKTAGDFDTIPAAFDREFERVKSEMGIFSERLDAVQRRIRALEQVSEETRSLQYKAEDLSRFIGNVQYAVKTFKNIGSDGELENEINILKNKIKDIESQIEESRISARKRRAIETVSMYASRMMPLMDTERPDDPIELLIDDLSIKVKGDKREDYLWEIGSGSNWLSYHVAISLSLQKYFVKLPHSPVPNFVVFDQPSQVYFPKVLATKKGEEKSEDYTFNDEEIAAVRKVFDSMSEIIKQCEGNLQIIVLDHAPDTVWGKVNNINLVEEWRNGAKLVPSDWY